MNATDFFLTKRGQNGDNGDIAAGRSGPLKPSAARRRRQAGTRLALSGNQVEILNQSADACAIADLFFRLHKVERIGMGIRKMKENMLAAGLREPAFAPDGFFRAIFYRLPEFALKEDIGKQPAKGWAESPRGLVKKLVEGLVENQKKILMLVAHNPYISKKTMSQEIGISTTAIDKNLSALKRRGLIRRIGPDKGRHWEVMG